MDLKQLQEEIQSAVRMLRDYADRAEEEKKRFGEALAETKGAIEALNKRISELEARLQRPDAGGTADTGELDRKAAFLDWMRKGVLEPEAKKALVENATGEILVPEELETELRRELPKITVVRRLVGSRPIRSDRLRLRSITEVTVGWGKLETGGVLGESTATPSDEYAYVEDLYGLTKIGEDELDDADANLQAFVVDSFGRAVAEAEDAAFIAGTGHANGQPQGVLTATGVSALAGSATGAITADDLIRLQYQVPDQYRRNGVYIVNPATELALRLLKDSNGQFLWQPALAADKPATFAGRPLYTSDVVPAISGTTGQTDDVAVFGDWRSGYTIRDRLGVTVQRLTELYAEQGLVGFKLRYRVLGYPIRTNAFAKLQVTS